MRVFALALLLACSAAIFAESFGNSARSAQVTFDPHTLSGVWWVKDPDPQRILERGKHGDASKCQTCHLSLHNNVAEPSLTPWAKAQLTISGQGSHDSPSAKHDAAMETMRTGNCDPIGVPAQFWYAQFAPFEFVVTRDRIYQFFETQHEYRVIRMNKSHPKHLRSTYMGDSVGIWDGDTLVVDTIGYNGKDEIEPVGVRHLMSDSFHLVERWRRVTSEEIELNATYHDPKIWGDKPWGGLHMEFFLQHDMQLEESFCSMEENKKFEETVTNPSTEVPR
jgi:hypothetical protein